MDDADRVMAVAALGFTSEVAYADGPLARRGGHRAEAAHLAAEAAEQIEAVRRRLAPTMEPHRPG